MNFDLEDTRRKLSADTPAGHRCSNLVEQIENIRTAEGDQRKHLAKNIGRQMAELTELAAKSNNPN